MDENFDEGKILIQEVVAVLPTDTAETLQARVLAVEHKILITAIAEVISGLDGYV